MTLYHWTPADRVSRILRDGLIPGREAVITSTTADVLCFGYDPAGAWALSGGVDWAPAGPWGLLQWRPDADDEWWDRGDGLEARTRQSISPDRLWWVGGRMNGGWPM